MELESLLPKPSNNGGIKQYLRRRHYKHLEGSGKKIKIIRLKRSTRKFWRIRTIPRLRWVIKSPLKMLSNFKNVYLNFMLKSLNIDSNIGGQIPKAPQVSKDYASDAFEVKLIYEISKALIASHELFPM
ncbi:hypothetical protein QL285_086791 [Trifolium repens]|nr:hypothetical protein QL285_086791 [Trifolium repens]